MKIIKMLCLLSVAVLPLAPSNVEPQPLMADPSECAPVSDQNLCGKCGDGTCVRQCGETATSCPADCGGVAL